MWPFNKKEEPKKKKLIKSFEYKLEKFNVGKSLIRIDLEDGTVLHKCIEGDVHQYISGYNMYVMLPEVTNSTKAAVYYMCSTLNSSGTALYDDEDASQVYYSKPRKAEIVSTEDHVTEHSIAYVVEKEVE